MGPFIRISLKHSSIYWSTAEAFGAKCYQDIHPTITHCITANIGTEKTYRAKKIGGEGGLGRVVLAVHRALGPPS